jgi:O-antigen/teichoic acid export membrane protein
MTHPVENVPVKEMPAAAAEMRTRRAIRLRLMRGISGTFGLKVISVLLALLTSIFLTRILGAKGYGDYAYAVTWLKSLVIIGVVGSDQLLVRELAVSSTTAKWGQMRGLLRFANLSGLVASLVLVAIVLGVGALLLDGDPVTRTSFFIAVGILPVAALSRLRQGALRGLDHAVLSQLPEMLIQPALILALFAGAHWVIGERFSAISATGLHAVAVLVAFLFGAALLRWKLPASVREADFSFHTRVWFRSALPLLLVGGMNVINVRIDTIMLGALRSTEEVGIYAVVTRGAEFVSFPLLATNAVMAPTIAALYAQGKMERLQRFVVNGARIAFGAAALIAAGLIGFSALFLSLFGPEFVVGRPILVIMCLAQLFNVGIGAVGLILMMTGYERDVARGVGLGAVMNFGLNILLVPRWGLIGAAAATTTALVVWNSVLVWYVFRRLGLYATVFGRFNRPRKA